MKKYVPLLVAGVLVSPLFSVQANASVSTEATGTVTGKHFRDRNTDGKWEEGEPGSNSAVALYNLDGSWVATVGTADDGTYVIPDVQPGQYRVSINPAGYQLTTPSEATVEVTAGGTTGADFGVRGGDITGVVWHDLNGDGVRQQDEPLLPDVQYWVGRSENFSDATGHYTWPDQMTGQYVFGFVAPEGMTFSPQHVGDPATDSDADSANGAVKVTVELVDGKITQFPNMDVGLVDTDSGAVNR
jgi:hypothetical protein